MTTIKLIMATLFTTLIAAAPAVANQSDGYHGYGMMGGGWWMIIGPLMMIAFLAAAVIVVVLIVRWIGGTGHGGQGGHYPPPGPAGKSPLDILRDRFARGDIDAEEYEQRRRILDG